MPITYVKDISKPLEIDVRGTVFICARPKAADIERHRMAAYEPAKGGGQGNVFNSTKFYTGLALEYPRGWKNFPDETGAEVAFSEGALKHWVEWADALDLAALGEGLAAPSKNLAKLAGDEGKGSGSGDAPA